LETFVEKDIQHHLASVPSHAESITEAHTHGKEKRPVASLPFIPYVPLEVMTDINNNSSSSSRSRKGASASASSSYEAKSFASPGAINDNNANANNHGANVYPNPYLRGLPDAGGERDEGGEGETGGGGEAGSDAGEGGGMGKLGKEGGLAEDKLSSASASALVVPIGGGGRGKLGRMPRRGTKMVIVDGDWRR